MVDLGCGSGILSIVAKENGQFNGKYSLVDSNESALSCAKMNLELFGIFDNKMNAQNADIVDVWFPV